MRRFLKSLGHASRGVYLIFNQRNFKIHIVFAILVGSMGFIFNISLSEWLVILFLFALVLTAEAINTSIENVLDCVSLDHREDIRDAKDSAAGAVLMVCIFAFIVGLVIFIPKIF